MRAKGELRSGLATQMRVIHALLMREIITRYGRENLGFWWLLVEPIIFTLGVVILWNTFHGALAMRIDITPFIFTGYSTLLLWRYCSFRGLKAIEPNRSLLHHRQVKIQDVFYARMILEVAGVTGAFLVLQLVLGALGLIGFPADPLLMIVGWLLISWFSACLGIILGCLSEKYDIVERLWHPTSYFLLPISGVFYMVEWLPKNLQTLALWVPMVHPVEMLRKGYWGDSVRAHYDFSYIGLVCLLMTLAALLLMNDRRLRGLA